MKVVLIFPPLVLKHRYAHSVGDAGGNLPPLGLLYLAAVLEKAGHEVHIIDSPVENMDLEQVIGRINSLQPNFMGVSSITSLAEKTKSLCQEVRKQFPNIKIFVGGPHPTALPEDVLKETGADVVIREEAENVILDLIENFEKYAQQKIVDAGKVKNLDDLPFPARHLINLNRYTALPNNYKRTPNSIHVVTSRGCPYPCTFCFDAKSGFRQRSIPHVMDELRHLKKKYGAVEIAFWDDTFTVNRKWVIEFCETMIREKMNMIWGCYSRLNLVDAELLKKMKEAGCWTMFFGIESGDQELLDNIKKLMTVKQLKEKVRLVQSFGIEIRGSFMVGMPGETPEKARKTIDFAIDLDPDYAQFSITTPYPGTELYKEVSKWGTLSEEYSEFHGWSPVFVPKGYKSAEELKAINREAFEKFYFRPKFILKKLFKIRSWTDIHRYWKGFRFVLGMTN
ncbi:MAG: cobalamin B12-binding domain-containing protein [Elusimicrobia bacterium]|nr:cobalamin B12-binding domain-containing protein [Elusimicrobiota bacterium]